ncbi:MAG TPA: sn-glycerol-3-phosphate ABC transporter ATP-binding protein UgpC [Limnochordia bacterium]|nr:sn-glycerol-3-phosphate ABC transporter ATP-binding protein UgpC [Limnochordia bacterium]
MAKVVLDHLTKRYGNVTAVTDANLEIRDKEFVVFVGPSGCGKTTTLRMVAGLEEISDGKLFIGDTLVNDMPPKDRDIAMVFQNYALYPHMDVYNNMAFGLKLRKFPRNEIDARVKQAARMLGIENLLDRKPKALSGGQRQRVALGRAIVREPKVFLMDEPLSNLDAKLRVTMRAELSKLHARLQTTAIYVTHDQTEAMTMGDRIVVMKDGLIQQVGAPLDIYDEPANAFVASFIGSPPMNLLDASLIRRGDQFVVHTDMFDLPIPAAKAAKMPNLAAHVDKEIIFGIRPEDIEDGRASKPDPEHTVNLLIDVTEPMGSEMIVYFNGGSAAPNGIISRFDPHSEAREAEQYPAVFNMEKCHIFDRESEVAVA